MTQSYSSWGNYPNLAQSGRNLSTRFDELPLKDSDASYLAYGLGRSYGDSCQNHQGCLITSALLNHFIAFDREKGLLRVEAGVSLESILQLIVPAGWFLPVTPGTKFVTVAGAIANDVHGKNHHLAASFGNHVTQFELLRSDGQRIICSEEANSEYFYATIGGLGLTGFITWAEFQLKPVRSDMMEVESIRYDNLDEFFELAEESSQLFEYTAVWLDSSAQGAQLGRGHFLRGNHVEPSATPQLPKSSSEVFTASKKTFPITPPISLVNNLSVQGFNALYYARQQQKSIFMNQHFDPFFYPLDGIHHWNRMYGKQGFLQYQCIVPEADAKQSIAELLTKIASSGQGSFLVVLKTMGDLASKGLLSFSRPGANLAIDFPYKGEKTLALLNELDAIVTEAGGALYPAKDARMPSHLFQSAYPRWQEMLPLMDPRVESDFWNRVAK